MAPSGGASTSQIQQLSHINVENLQLNFLMSIRTRVLAVIGAFGAVYLALYLRTRWGPPLLDAGYAPSATFKQAWGITQESMDALPTLTPSAWIEENYGDGKSS
jgi:hypothetical protein